MISEYELAKEKLINLDLKICEDYFRKNKLYLELGYCELLKGNLENSKKLFANISNYNPRAHWAVRMIQFIEGYVTFLPTYFEIRNFLELDIDSMIDQIGIDMDEYAAWRGWNDWDYDSLVMISTDQWNINRIVAETVEYLKNDCGDQSIEWAYRLLETKCASVCRNRDKSKISLAALSRI